MWLRTCWRCKARSPGGVIRHLLSKQFSAAFWLLGLTFRSPIASSPTANHHWIYLVWFWSSNYHYPSLFFFFPTPFFPCPLLAQSEWLLSFYVLATAALKRGPNGVNNDCSKFSSSAVRNRSNRGFVYYALCFFPPLFCDAWQDSAYYAAWPKNWIDETDSPLSFLLLFEVSLLHLALGRDYHVNVCTCESLVRHTRAYRDNGAI